MIRLFPSFLLLVVFFVTTGANAQDKQLTLEDAVYLNPDVLPKRMNQLNWMGKSDNFSYVEKNQLIRAGVNADSEKEIVNLDDLNAGLSDLGLDSIKRFPRIKFVDDIRFRFTFKNNLFLYDIITRTLEKLNSYPEKAKNVNINPETYAIAYTLDNNLFLSIDGKKVQVTNDDDKEIVNGQTVHRVEFGIKKGIFWSPTGNQVAFYRKNESMVTDYPLVDLEPRIAELENIKYPMAGMASEHVTLGVFNPETSETVFMKTGEPSEQYLTAVTWDPSGEFIYIALLNRDQNHLKLNKYNSVNGEFVKTLFEEKSDKYVEPQNPLYFLSSNPNYFIWLSQRDGWNHLYLYNTEGELLKQVTQGEWAVTKYLGEAKNGKLLYFTGTKESPIEKHIYSIGTSNGKITKISNDHGSHSALVNNSGKYIIDIYSSTDIAREYKIQDSKGKTIRVLKENFDPLVDYQLGEMSIFTLKSDNGDDLYCRLIKPTGFVEGKKYPVFFYVYGGPHSQLVSDSWLGAAGIFQNYMAQQGYVVFTMDNHGTANRGRDFEQAIFRNLGVLEVEDQMKGVEYLKSLDFVDADRIGVDGWSYGGFMTIAMMLKNPGVFKAGCAGGPVIDWKYYEIMYGERYMDTPESNPEGYENASLLNNVDQLEGDLLIIHGTKDPTVVWQNSLNFIKKCVDEGKQLDYFVYPGHGHNVRGKDRVHLYEKIRRFFDEKLK